MPKTKTKKKKTSLPTRIYKYGACAPRSKKAQNAIHEILFKASRYYNKLIEIERARYARFVEIRREHAPQLAALEDAFTALDDEAFEIHQTIKRSRQTHWQQTKGEKTLAIDPAELDARLDAIKVEKKRISDDAKPLREAFKARLAPFNDRFKKTATERAAGGGPRIKERINAEVLGELVEDPAVDAVWKAIVQSDARAVAEGKSARAICGLPPGTYQKVEEAAQQAKKASLPRPPRFKSFRGEGRIAVQLGKSTFGDLFDGTNTKLQLVKDTLPPGQVRRGKQERYWRAKIRIGSDGRKPIWAEFPVKLHRRPPLDTKVQWAWILVRKQGQRTRYELQLTLKHHFFDVPKRPAGVGDGGHIQLGWSEVKGGIRIATWPGGDFVVPWSMIRRAERAHVLEGYADKHLETVKRVLKATLRGSRFEGGVRLDHFRSDRSRGRLIRGIRDFAVMAFGEYPLKDLWLAWKKSKPVDLFVSLPEASRWLSSQLRVKRVHQQARLAWWLFTWTKKDQHLRQWSIDAEKGFVRARDAYFRERAILLATEFETMTIDNYSIADLKKKPELARSETYVLEHVAYNLHHAAPGRFREILLEVMGDRCRESPRPAENPATARDPKTSNKNENTSTTSNKAQAPGGSSADLSQSDL